MTKVPRFQEEYFSISSNICTIKFYAWESIFMGAMAWLDLPEYTPPVFWYVLEYIIKVGGSSASQIFAVLTIIIFFSMSSNPMSYARVALLVDSIDSLIGFAKTIGTTGQPLINIKEGVAFMQTLVDAQHTKFIAHVSETSKDGVAVELDNCAFSWGEKKFGLDPIMLRVNTGESVTIIGRIGGGKSSLLSGLCSEMPVVGGHGHVYGKIGYVSQKPYIMNDTFRENVLMGAEYDEKWLHQVLEACALSEDVEKFAAGNLSEIGPNGINLSGGQKVQLALARALYLKADVYIFDNLLAAVYAWVEHLIFERVLASGGIIGDKTHILVTHAEHLVPLSSKVVTLAKGHAEIVEQQPIDFVSAANTDEHILASSTEIASTSNANTNSGKFTIHPELRDLPFKLWQLWRFIKLSGYRTVAIVALIQLVNAYAIYYVESLRISPMVDSNPNMMRQSMSKYLILNALVGVVCMQLNSFEVWVRDTLWTKRVAEKMRRQLISSILSLPLTLAKRFSRLELGQMFMVD
ncbi:Canalicular multispecific organic anion transporter 1 [Kickxella alabastrina]|uniref:Canalicular multispecific organic anion transporter 1 n=1 Tax=Kickxella alabastrina TaxID=61397 RepID=A0ACC1IR68_9FUNG|nr:Canalicular multispecific organic anion transporter 1 [Kickxella alabastrina]